MAVLMPARDGAATSHQHPPSRPASRSLLATGPQALHQLQQSAGNSAVAALLGSQSGRKGEGPVVQPILTDARGTGKLDVLLSAKKERVNAAQNDQERDQAGNQVLLANELRYAIGWYRNLTKIAIAADAPGRLAQARQFFPELQKIDTLAFKLTQGGRDGGVPDLLRQGVQSDLAAIGEIVKGRRGNPGHQWHTTMLIGSAIAASQSHVNAVVGGVAGRPQGTTELEFLGASLFRSGTEAPVVSAAVGQLLEPWLQSGIDAVVLAQLAVASGGYAAAGPAPAVPLTDHQKGIQIDALATAVSQAVCNVAAMPAAGRMFLASVYNQVVGGTSTIAAVGAGGGHAKATEAVMRILFLNLVNPRLLGFRGMSADPIKSEVVLEAGRIMLEASQHKPAFSKAAQYGVGPAFGQVVGQIAAFETALVGDLHNLIPPPVPVPAPVPVPVHAPAPAGAGGAGGGGAGGRGGGGGRGGFLAGHRP